jgi:hypothetical protein
MIITIRRDALRDKNSRLMWNDHARRVHRGNGWKIVDIEKHRVALVRRNCLVYFSISDDFDHPTPMSESDLLHAKKTALAWAKTDAAIW